MNTLTSIKPDAEFPPELLKRHADMTARMEACRQKQAAAIRERDALLGKIAAQFSLASFERIRVIRGEIPVLLQEERTIRAELDVWMGDCGPAVQELLRGARAKEASAKEAAAGKLAKIGYTDSAIREAGGDVFGRSFFAQLLSLHPEVVRARDRVKELLRVEDGIFNRFTDGSPFSANRREVEAIGAKLAVAVRECQSLSGVV